MPPDGATAGRLAQGAHMALIGGGMHMVVRVGSNRNDTLDGSTGADTLFGEGGNDSLLGLGGVDTLFGGVGNDRLYGAAGNDWAYGGDGNDVAFGADGDDRLYGDAGNDTLRGAAGRDLLFGGAGDDTLWGGGGIDTLFGGDGNDQLRGEIGNDIADGGAGNDTFIVAGQSSHFSWTTVAGVTTLVDLRPDLNGNESTDQLSNVEFIRFDDRTVALNTAPPPPNQPPSAIADVDASADAVAENATNGTAVGVVAASSDPEGGTVTYTLTNNAGGRFAIDQSGVVTVANGALLDHEAAVSHTIIVRATDPLGAFVERSFTIAVLNVNEAPGVVSDVDNAANRITTAAAGSVVGVTARATDPDGDLLTYSLVDQAGNPITNGPFAINAQTGVVSVADATQLGVGQATIHVRATDPLSLSGPIQSFTIEVEDGNPPPNRAPTDLRDIDPVANRVTANAANGTYVGIDLDATDPDNDPLTWSLSDNAGGRFAIDSATGRITVANSASLTAGSYQVTAVVSDGALSTSQSFTIDVAAAGTGGSQFRVNGTVAGRQQALGDHGGSAIAALSGGGYVVVWESEGQDSASDPGGIYGQRFDAAGNRLGAEFRVHTATTDVQTRASVTALADGKFVVSWETFDNSKNLDVHYRIFNADGTADLADRDAHSASAGGLRNQLYGASTALANGGFVLTWTSDRTDLSGTANDDLSGYGVYARIFDANGTGGAQFLVNNRTVGDQKLSTAATLSNGEFVIAWSDADSEFSTNSDIRLQRFSSAGAELGSEILVNTTTAGNQSFASIAALNSGFVVTWTGTSQPGGSGNDIYMQRFNATGGKLGGEVRVNLDVDGSQTRSSVIGLDDGGFLVAWQSSVGDGSGNGVFAQRFDSGGNRVGATVLVNQQTAGGQTDPHLAELTAGQIVAIWSGNGTADTITGSGGGVFGRMIEDLVA